MNPTLSIIIVSFNTQKLTLGAIASIYQEGSKLPIQIIVVDNNSQDGSREALRKLKEKDQEFVLIENKDNLGFAKANNQGIRIAKGDFILLLNSDCKVLPGALAKLTAFAQKTADAGVIGARLINADGSIQPSCFNFPTVGLSFREFFMGKSGVTSKFYPRVKRAVVVDAIVGAAFLITPKAIDKVGYLDERYFMYFEDLDYCRKIKQSGLKTYYLPHARIIHFHGASGEYSGPKTQNRILIASSKIYHGRLGYYIYTLVLWLGQKWEKLSKTLK